MLWVGRKECEENSDPTPTYVKSRSGRALDHLYVSSPVVLKRSEAVREKDTLAPTASSKGRLPELLWDTLPLIP